jgi:hypothetical protein
MERGASATKTGAGRDEVRRMPDASTAADATKSHPRL